MVDERERRREARSRWPGKVTRLEDDHGDDLRLVTTVDERLAMMWELAVTAWALGGQPIPDYERSEAPGRVIRSAR